MSTLLQHVGTGTWAPSPASAPLLAAMADWGIGEWARAVLVAAALAGAVALVVVAVRKRWPQALTAFVGEVQAELKKSAWPTWSQLWDSTVVIIVVTLILAFYIGVADVVFQRIVRLLVTQ